jgi:Concanavalin A-like lectin/glucanases superfamily
MLSWSQFRNLPYIKNLPAHEQSRQYFLYESNMLIEAKAAAISTSSAGSGGGRIKASTTTTTTTSHVPGLDFTIEWFAKRSATYSLQPDSPRAYSLGQSNGISKNAVSIEQSGGQFIWWVNGSAIFLSRTIDQSLFNVHVGQWYHFAISRDNGNIKAYFNGYRVDDGLDHVNSASLFYPNVINSGTQSLNIGADPSLNSQHGWFEGYISNFRWSNVVRYPGVTSSGTYSIPSHNLVSDSSTKLLLTMASQSSPYSDSSSYSKVVTPHGATQNPQWNSDNPFGLSSSGSVYFKGTTYSAQYLSLSSSSDWTL